MLQINQLTYRIEGKTLFDKVNLSIFEKQKLGLTGRNGVGKSTLIRLIKQEIAPESGEIKLRKNIKLSVTSQEIADQDLSVFEYVLNADLERRDLLKQATHSKDPLEISNIHNRLSDIQAHTAESRARQILNGLGFLKDQQELKLRQFSSGWQMRANLASCLFARPDFLILDEPGNYLDLEGSIWLKNYLKKLNIALLLISHDRALLDGCINHIAHIKDHKIQTYNGNYSEFEQKLAEQQQRQMKLKTKQENEKRKLEAFINRFKAKASKSSQAQSRIKRLNKMQIVSTLIEKPVSPFLFPEAKPALSPPLFRLEDIDIGYDSKNRILSDLNLRIDTDDRIGILGRNGAGKSTLAKLLCQKLRPISGKIYFHKKIQIGFFTQTQIESLHQTQTAYDYIKRLMPDSSEAQKRASLAHFGFDKMLSDTQIKYLSGGEKTRLMLNLTAFSGKHILILDEPTNHLDMDSRAELIHCLNAYSGSLILISHDEYLLNMTVDQLWLVENGSVSSYQNTLETYQAEILKKETVKNQQNNSVSKSKQRQIRAQKRAQTSDFRKKISKIETQLETLQKERASIDQDLSNPEIFQQTEHLKILSQKRKELSYAINELETLWLLKTEDYEKKLNEIKS